MKCVRNIFLLVLSLCVFSSVHANETLLNHVKATSQAMSAFYMQGLSEGNEKYLKEFKGLKKESITLLRQYVRNNGSQGEELLQQWKGFSDQLVLKYDQEYGWEVDNRVRQDFRGYLSDIYKMVEDQKSNYQSVAQKKLLSLVQIEALSARFFDISSTYDGVESLFTKDKAKLNPQAISADFKATLTELVQLSEDTAMQKKLSSAKQKWSFVENSVVNYQGQTAYFVVYATKNKIKKALQAL
jgi:hypothetical protein